MRLLQTCDPLRSEHRWRRFSGTVELRWRPLLPGRRLDVTLAVRAISVRSEERRQAVVAERDLPEHLACLHAEWQEAAAGEAGGEQAIRDRMVRSFCPQIHGMYLVKLAVLLALCSGDSGRAVSVASGAVRATGSGDVGGGGGRGRGGTEPMQTRGSSHVLLVGDPGLAKSKLLRFAAAVAVRAVQTTGIGCSSAGLTAAAVKVRVCGCFV